jgi:hypothetical protein
MLLVLRSIRIIILGCQIYLKVFPFKLNFIGLYGWVSNPYSIPPPFHWTVVISKMEITIRGLFLNSNICKLILHSCKRLVYSNVSIFFLHVTY